jgi:hypothetical protein
VKAPAFLSEGTIRRLRVIFAEDVQKDAEALLVHECGRGLPFQDGASPEDLERIRYAALRLSKGRIDKLCDAIQLAQEDWRDLLVAAGFGHDANAHHSWNP